MRPPCLASLLAGLALFSLPADAATVLQGGPWTAGHAPMYSVSGGSQPVVQDSGPAGGGAVGLGLSEMLLVARGTGNPPFVGQGTGPYGTNFCDYDAPITSSAGYHFFCFSANAAGGGGLIAYGAGGGASNQNLNINVNGTSYQFPFSIGGIVGPGTTVVNDIALWNNTNGTLLKDGGAIPTCNGTNQFLQWTGSAFACSAASAQVTQKQLRAWASANGSPLYVYQIDNAVSSDIANAVNIGWLHADTMVTGDALYTFIQSTLGFSSGQMATAYTAMLAFPP